MEEEIVCENGVMNILGHDFDIVFDPHYELKHGDIGQCNFYLQRITIDSSKKQSMQRMTAFHELVEAVNLLLELNLSHAQRTALSAGLFEIFETNPDLSVWISTGGTVSPNGESTDGSETHLPIEEAASEDDKGDDEAEYLDEMGNGPLKTPKIGFELC